MKINLKNLSSALIIFLVISFLLSAAVIRTVVPKIDEYSEDLKSWINGESFYEIDFSAVNARWTVSGPELIFDYPRLVEKNSKTTILSADQLLAEIGIIDFLLGRSLAFDHLKVSNLDIILEYSTTHGLSVQGKEYKDLLALFSIGEKKIEEFKIEGDALNVSIKLTSLSKEFDLFLPITTIEINENELLFDTSFDLPESFGKTMLFSATKRLLSEDNSSAWSLYVEGDGLSLSQWLNLTSFKYDRDLSGLINLDSWMEFDHGRLQKVTSDVSIVDLKNSADVNSPIGISSRLEFSRNDFGWLAVADKFQFESEGRYTPESRIEIQAYESNSNDNLTLDSSISYIALEDLRILSGWLRVDFLENILKYNPNGIIRDASLNISNIDDISSRFDFSTRLSDVNIEIPIKKHSVTNIMGLNGEFFLNQTGGRINLESQNLRLKSDDFIDDDLSLSNIGGSIIWRENSEGIVFLSDQIVMKNSYFDMSSSLEITWPKNKKLPYVDIESFWNIDDVVPFKRLLPKKYINPNLYDWIQEAFLSGSVKNGKMKIAGMLENFPFKERTGIFQVRAKAEDMVLNYARNWPDAKIISMDFELDSDHIFSLKNQSIHAGMIMENAMLEIKDLSEPELSIVSNASSDLETINNFLVSTPIDDYFGGMLRKMSFLGTAEYDVDIKMPLRLKEREKYNFITGVKFYDSSIDVEELDPVISNLNGFISISRKNIFTDNLNARWLDSDVKISASRAPEDDLFLNSIVSIKGKTSTKKIEDQFNLSFDEKVSGTSNFEVNLNIPKYDLDNPSPFFINVSADLDHISINLPEPFKNLSNSKKILDLNIFFPEKDLISYRGGIDKDISWNLNFKNEINDWNFERGSLVLGAKDYSDSNSRGLHIRGEIKYFDFEEWEQPSESSNKKQDNLYKNIIRSADVRVGNLMIFGRSFPNQRIIVNKGSTDWIIETEGEKADGNISLPYTINYDDPLNIDMNKLYIGDVEKEWGSTNADPLDYPSINIEIDDFSYSNYRLGSLKASFLKTEDGLRARDLISVDQSFSIEGDFGWIIDDQSEIGSTTYVKAVLKSNDVSDTLSKLDYQPIIDSDDLELNIDVKWEGGPNRDFLNELDGKFDVQLGSGQLEEVEPGAGRVFGLLSIVALPRRLSLDFRDVIEKGFGFDEILGSFEVTKGRASTCNLSLKGPAADVGIIGSVDLAQMKYNQSAIVSTNFGNTLPLVGAVVAGPPAAAALLVFSQIFKKPLQEMAQIYYDIKGSFEDPDVKNTSASYFSLLSEEFKCSQ